MYPYSEKAKGILLVSAMTRIFPIWFYLTDT